MLKTYTCQEGNTPVTGTLTFNPGESVKNITIPITDDNLAEGNESFNVILSNPQNTLIDEVRVWDVVRNEADILATHNTELNGDEAGLLGYWNFDNAVEDGTNNENNGRIIGGEFIPLDSNKTPDEIVYTVTDLPDNGTLSLSNIDDTALSFDGIDDIVEIPHDDSLNLTTFTVETWINLGQIKSNWQPIITKQNNGGGERNYGLFIRPNETRVHFSFMDSNGSTYRSYDSISSLTLNEWNHIGMTYDGSTFSLYINGELDQSFSISSTVFQNTYPVKIGREISAFNPLAGNLDEVRIWNTARTAQEIQNNYQTTLTGNETGLVAYLDLNNITGNIATDVSGNGNDANINGATQTDSNPILSTRISLNINDTFTQEDIDNNRLIYTPDNITGVQDNFKFMVSDGTTTNPEQTFNIAHPVDLSNWTQQGVLSNGDWTVTGNQNQFVKQSINGNPTFFVSPFNFINRTVNGTIEVVNL